MDVLFQLSINPDLLLIGILNLLLLLIMFMIIIIVKYMKYTIYDHFKAGVYPVGIVSKLATENFLFKDPLIAEIPCPKVKNNNYNIIHK